MSPTTAHEQTLRRGALQLGLRLSDAQIAALLAYLALLLRWNAAYNLTAVRDPGEMVTRHLLDSLSLVAHVPAGRVADLGSGAGLPGIPLAIARPELSLVLVESNGKKARFLREVKRELALANVEVAETRAEAERGAPDCEVVTARALAELGSLAQLSRVWLKPGGVLLAMKGPAARAELAGLPDEFALQEIVPLTVPGLDGERNLVVVKRLARKVL